jgi:hypothetical protein
VARKKKRRKKHSGQPAAAPVAAPAPVAPVADAIPAATNGSAAPVETPAPQPIAEPTAPPPTPPAEPAAQPGPPSEPKRDDAPLLPVGRPKEDLIVEDLDDDLDDGDLASLVAAVADLDDGPPAPKQRTARASTPTRVEPAREEIQEVHDLDDDDAPPAVDRLIAQVGRGTPAKTRVEEDDEELPVIDLDEDEAPPARVGAKAASPRPAPDVSRLAQAAAVGAVDELDLPAISLDLGDVSTPEARARLLAEALAHAEHKEARYRVPLEDTRRLARWKSLAASVVLVLAGVVAVAPPAWVRPEPPAQLTAGARARGIRLALLLQAQQIEAYRVRTNELPETLDVLPATLPGVRYARSGRSYQLVAFDPAGTPIVYDASDPSPAFLILSGALTHPAEAP